MTKNIFNRLLFISSILAIMMVPVSALALITPGCEGPNPPPECSEAPPPAPVPCNLTNVNLQGLLSCVRQTLIIPLINILLGLAFLVFCWGIVKYLYKADNDAERKKGKNLILFGIIGLFVMVSVWGIVNILSGTFFGPTGPATPPIPQLPTGLL